MVSVFLDSYRVVRLLCVHSIWHIHRANWRTLLCAQHKIVILTGKWRNNVNRRGYKSNCNVGTTSRRIRFVSKCLCATHRKRCSGLVHSLSIGCLNDEWSEVCTRRHMFDYTERIYCNQSNKWCASAEPHQKWHTYCCCCCWQSIVWPRNGVNVDLGWDNHSIQIMEIFISLVHSSNSVFPPTALDLLIFVEIIHHFSSSLHS